MYGPLCFPLSTTCSSCHFHWHFPCWYLRQVVEVPDGTLSYHHEFKISLGGMVPVHRGINSTPGCCAGWDTEGNLQWLSCGQQTVLCRRCWCFSALCLNPVCIFSPWNRNDKYLSNRSCLDHVKFCPCPFSPRPKPLCVALLRFRWNPPALHLPGPQHSQWQDVVPQTLDLRENWLFWGPGKTCLWSSSSPWSISCSKIIFRDPPLVQWVLMAKGASPRLCVLLPGPCSQKVAIISLLFQTSLCCSICLHMAKDTAVLTSLAGIIIPSWQILPLTWSCAVRPRNRLYLLQWGGDAAHSALSLLRQVSIPVGKGRKYFYLGCCAAHQVLGMCCCCGDAGWSVPCAADLTAQSTGGMGSESCAQLSTTSSSLQSCAGKSAMRAVGKATLRMLKIPWRWLIFLMHFQVLFYLHNTWSSRLNLIPSCPWRPWALL